MATELLTPILTGIKNINYFEGRLLTARDLREQEEANRTYRRQLARILGSGVVEGLKVVVEQSGADTTQPTVKITKGLAVNADGNILELPDDYDGLVLSRIQGLEEPDVRVFRNCSKLPSKSLVPGGAGLYVLVMSPVDSYQDFAPKSGLQQQGIATNCGRRYLADGIQFGLVLFDPTLMPDISEATRIKLRDDLLDLSDPIGSDEPERLSKLRNLVAHICFGTEARLNADTLPFETDDQHLFGFDRLIGKYEGLRRCDVPLALIYWTQDGITYLDHWSVRRRLKISEEINGQINAPIALQVADAMMLQFQEHMNSLANQTINNFALSQQRVDQLFRYLPASGAVAIAGPGSPKGFILNNFFDGRASGTPTVISHTQAITVEEESLNHLPIDVEITDVIQLYWIRENLSAVASGSTSQQYLFFATRALHGFRETDSAYATLDQTWKSYNNALRKQVLLPITASDDALPVRAALQTDFQAIIQFAMTQAMLASARELDRASVFHVFSELYDLQKTLAADLPSTFPADANLSQREEFADRLTELLNAPNTGGGAPGVLPALGADDYQKLLDAQQLISTYVSSWSGQYVFGSIAIRHTGSPDGDKLVPGDPPFRFEFTLIAFTDKRTEVNLTVAITNTPTGTWGDALEIKDHDTGAPISLIVMNKLEQRVIDVTIKPPANAVPDEDVLLEVSASIPPPTDNTWQKQLALRTSLNAGDPIVWQLELINTQPGGTGRTFSVPPAPETLNFIFESRFLASRPPLTTTATFTASFTFTDSVRDDWRLSILNQPGAETAPGSGIFRFDIPLESGGAGISTTVSVGVPTTSAAVNRTCVMNVSLVTEIIDPESGETVAVTDAFDPFTVISVAS